MSRILITGINGFVGQHLLRELTDHGHEVVGVGGPRKPADLADYFELDLTRRARAENIDFTTIDGVVHLAGLAAVGPSFAKPMLYVKTNIGIEVNLFEAALAQGVRPRFLIISSGALYDPKAPQPFTEQSPTLPASPYAVSKLGQEQMSEYYSSRGFACIIARPFNHIGPGQNPGFILPDLAQQIVEVERGKAKEIRVGNLDAKRDYTDVRDIVRAYRLLLEKGRSGEVYNICSGKPLSGEVLLTKILKLSTARPEVRQDPTKIRPSDDPLLYGSHDKLTSDTGWQPEIKLEQTLADVMADWRGRKSF